MIRTVCTRQKGSEERQLLLTSSPGTGARGSIEICCRRRGGGRFHVGCLEVIRADVCLGWVYRLRVTE